MSSTTTVHDAPVGNELRAILNSTWTSLQQPATPSLREVLGAYNAKGTGDRDMLLALLNAKSAEDNRIAATTTLQNTMLQFYTARSGAPAVYSAPSTHTSPRMMMQPAPLSPDSLSHSTLPPPPHHHYSRHADVSLGQVRHHPYAHAASHPREREWEHADEPPRKRSRDSRSPPHAHRDSDERERSRSPRSRHGVMRRPSFSAGSGSTLPPIGSVAPRQAANMHIGSLLASSSVQAAAGSESEPSSWAARTSAERSTR